MPLGEAAPRAKLIDPAIHARGWTEDLIRREVTAGARPFIRCPLTLAAPSPSLPPHPRCPLTLPSPPVGERERGVVAKFGGDL